LAQHVFAGRPYATLEDPDEEAFARNDPRGFLAQFPDGAVLDEIQRCPQLLSYLQGIADQDGRMGLYLLTGSQQFGLTAGVTQTLAGRAALVELLPFSSSELRQAGRLPESVDDLLFSGFYPPLHDRGIAPSVWHPNYIRTYIERDLRQMITVSDLHTFQDFLSLCAGRVGQLVNLSSLANDCAISPNTAKAWLSVLEASYIIHLLRPHHKNFNKRIIKTPKLYFYDVGLAARLLGIENREQLHNHAYRGALFETFVIAELLKKRYNAGQPSNLYFWRDRTGNEIDVLVDRGDHLLPVEIKSGRTVTEAYFKGLRNWTAVAGKEAGRPYLVYAGNKRQERQEAAVVPWFDAALIGD
jgi:predicted AAA+ superfamily ATPase